MEEAPENGKESSNHANGMNEYVCALSPEHRAEYFKNVTL